MIVSLRGRLGLLFLAFFCLVGVSVAATSWTVETQKKDAVVINLAGRQRMLIQQMARDVLEIEKGHDRRASLQVSIRTFDQTLQALMDGGQAPYVSTAGTLRVPLGGDTSVGERTVDVPATRHPNIRAGLQQVRRTWNPFRRHLNVITAAAPDSPDVSTAGTLWVPLGGDTSFRAAIQAVEHLSPRLVQQADDVVRLYEATSEQKVARLQWIQVVFFVSALALLIMGAGIAQKSVVHPLRVLGSVAERIGRGDLSTPVEVTGPREIELMAQRFDAMRVQLQTSQTELIAWTEELEARVAQRTRELAALYEVSREISSRLDVDHVLRSVTDKARELLGGEVAVLCLLNEMNPVLDLQAVSGPQEALCGTRVLVHNAPAAQVLEANGALSCGIDSCVGACGMIAAPFRVSHLAAPLRVGDRVIGALCVGGRRAGFFSDEAANLLTKLANSAAMALENARLYQQAERVATLEERQRIAAEMHDGLAQTLSYLHLQVDQIAERIAARGDTEILTSLERIRDRLAGTVDEVRAHIADLSSQPAPPQVLSKLLAGAVQEATDGQIARRVLITPELENLKVPSDIAEQIHHIVKEAVTNACRHADAGRLQVRLEPADRQAVITVEDDGRGFEPGRPSADGRPHFGLSTMQARATRIGGRLTVESVPGHGTRVTLWWPLDNGDTGGTIRETHSSVGG